MKSLPETALGLVKKLTGADDPTGTGTAARTALLFTLPVPLTAVLFHTHWLPAIGLWLVASACAINHMWWVSKIRGNA